MNGIIEVVSWPPVDSKGIPTHQFLQSCEVVVQCFGALGTVLAPVKSDVEGNVNKLKKIYITNQAKYEYLLEMIQHERLIKSSNATDALLWLKRALTFICRMLESVVREVEGGAEDPDMKSNYLTSYDETLRKYHNWAIQKVFTVCINQGLLPGCRSLLLSMPTSRDAPEGATTAELAAKLKPFIIGLRENLTAVITFYHAEGLDKVSAI